MTKCPHTDLKFLKFVAWIAAPGYGQSWECTQCGEAMWSPHGAERAKPYSEMGQPPELSIEDII